MSHWHVASQSVNTSCYSVCSITMEPHNWHTIPQNMPVVEYFWHYPDTVRDRIYATVGRPSRHVCHPAAARCSCGFAAVGPAARRNRLIAARRRADNQQQPRRSTAMDAADFFCTGCKPRDHSSNIFTVRRYAVCAVAMCLSVRPPVCLSITSRYCIEKTGQIELVLAWELLLAYRKLRLRKFGAERDENRVIGLVAVSRSKRPLRIRSKLWNDWCHESLRPLPIYHTDRVHFCVSEGEFCATKMRMRSRMCCTPLSLWMRSVIEQGCRELGRRRPRDFRVPPVDTRIPVSDAPVIDTKSEN